MTTRNRRVNDPTLADAFDADDSEDDDEPDDRQRLVRQNTDPVNHAAASDQAASTGGSGASTPPSQPAGAVGNVAAANSSNRIFGSGIQNDGIFSNLTAKPERSGTEKEEQPPVR